MTNFKDWVDHIFGERGVNDASTARALMPIIADDVQHVHQVAHLAMAYLPDYIVAKTVKELRDGAELRAFADVGQLSVRFVRLCADSRARLCGCHYDSVLWPMTQWHAGSREMADIPNPESFSVEIEQWARQFMLMNTTNFYIERKPDSNTLGHKQVTFSPNDQFVIPAASQSKSKSHMASMNALIQRLQAQARFTPKTIEVTQEFYDELTKHLPPSPQTNKLFYMGMPVVAAPTQGEANAQTGPGNAASPVATLPDTHATNTSGNGDDRS